jgi:GNAT superfamily N-acetyltransferase
MNAETDVTIAAPTPSDRAAWDPLYAGYCAFYKVEHTAAKADTVWSWLMDTGHPVKGFLARDSAGVVVGFTHYRGYPRPIAGGDGCFLDDLFVTPQARGRGVAEKLIAAVVDEARRRGWPVVRWITAEDNASARALYDRVAVKTHWVTYEIRP